jgi:hypothetical protein
MLGITESVFCPNPDAKADNNQPHQVPLHILRLQANNKNNMPSVGDIARNAGPPKIKRPMETNRLETGPPVVKLGRFEDSIAPLDGQQPSTSNTVASQGACQHYPINAYAILNEPQQVLQRVRIPSLKTCSSRERTLIMATS